MHIRVSAAWLALGCVALPWVASAQEVPTASAAEPLVDAVAAPDAPAADAVEPSSEIVAQMAQWITASRDNGDLPFMIIDKVAAEVIIFDAQGQFLGAAPALLGIAPGDESAPGVGDRELSAIKPEDRTTPAGRFVAKYGIGSGNRKVLWVDYVTAISLHPVVTANKKERRLQRLNSPSPEDNRITYGCINVPASFYAKVVSPLFKETSGVVYILPETKPLNEVFAAFHAQGQPSPP
ncbi:hypothetical protein [Sphingomonas sp. LaA6.9]|uniref:hypothetical protein n=1 Tax=Sphingomonas sp. LaA6.9 TaxID=2919914 RepID=UPI001F4F41F3|nr:hypothetical protein [Sphingomonas sp. LaA6.9]MCJ8157573.1 hypothetical protein [Sphingomonas sp. LaA6.9]